jgi:hypothetical protein
MRVASSDWCASRLLGAVGSAAPKRGRFVSSKGDDFSQSPRASALFVAVTLLKRDSRSDLRLQPSMLCLLCFSITTLTIYHMNMVGLL